MKLRQIAAALFIACLPGAICVHAGANEDAVLAVVNTYKPGTCALGNVVVNKVTISTSARTITVDCSEATAYIPFTAETLEACKADIRTALGSRYANYKVVLKADGQDLDALTLFAPKNVSAPTETTPFITAVGAPAAPAGLDGRIITMWQSHGWYFEPKLNRWEWQRARIFQTVEDLYTQGYVMPFLMPMLENAGAYVISPRERDINTTEIIVDADNAATPGYAETNGAKKWGNASVAGFGWDGQYLVNSQNPFRDGSARRVAAVAEGQQLSTAVWKADIPAAGEYAVYVSYVTEQNSATDAHYTVNAANGPRQFVVNQKMGGGTWIYLGHFFFNRGNDQTIVELTNQSADSKAVVTADAVKIGGGMGVVSRIVKEPLDSIDYQHVASGYPKFVEGARYFMQWAGAPDSVYTPTENVNDYTDDYRGRGLWVNWLAGGSSVLPDREGLHIPVDLSFAFHTDAGTFKSDSIVGTLGIYSTAGTHFDNGQDRSTSRDLCDLVMTNICNDVRATYEPRWTRRGMWDKSYFEARVPEVPAMLLELLSHQNFADMKYGLDPAFRFVVSRAIYKGMLQFIAHRDGRPYVVQPLPVQNFAISASGNHTYRLAWAETVDTLEATAHPTYYIIEHRVGDALGFTRLATSTNPWFDVTVDDTDIHSYRIIAANDGGVSFPSEVLALCDMHNDTAPVMVVNGFTRVSAPDWFEASEAIAGFYDQRDHGVPYVRDISFIGSQFEYRRDIPWMDDDAAGFGASRSDYEDRVIAGNTFDYVYTHGKAIAAAGRSFISSSVAAYQASTARYQVVDLILGKQKEIKHGRGVYGTYFKTFPAALQAKITSDAQAGTCFFVSGAYVATDLWDNPNSDEATAEVDQRFATEVLGYHWRVDQACVEGQAYQVPCRFKEFTGGNFDYSTTLNEALYCVESPDSFYGADPAKACTLLRYSENNLVAGIAANMGNYRTVIAGFPFETVTNEAQRNAFMSQILTFFSNK